MILRDARFDYVDRNMVPRRSENANPRYRIGVVSWQAKQVSQNISLQISSARRIRLFNNKCETTIIAA